MDVFFIAATMVIVFAVVLLLRKRNADAGARPGERQTAPNKQASEFHAVRLKVGGNACQAAKELRGKRHLSQDAPKIPLEDCDAVECRCRFVHYKDRRDHGDRRNPFGQGTGAGSGRIGEEHRDSNDRRDDS